ncbi:MAG: MFS transporter [Coriobacteriales bacterium]|nr:MFS transporter [Coriobacteriales bacterium]
MYYVLYGRDDKGIYCMDDGLGEYMWGESVSESNRIANVREVFANKEESSKEMHRGSSRHEDTMYRTVYIPATGEGSNDFVIEVGSKMKSFTSSVASNLVRNTLALLVLALVIYMTYAELQACGKCVLRYRHIQQTAEKGAVSALARPFALTTMMLAGIDAVMSTLIAREMLVAAGMGDVTALVTVPAVMLGVGQALGQGVYGLLGSKVGLRKLMARGATAMLACAILVAASVVSGSFWAYCAAKFVLAVPFGLLYTAAYSLRRHAVTPEQQHLAKAGVKRSNTSSAALGTALGGYAAQGLGNVGVYIMIALVSLAVITMAIILLPKGTLPPEDDRDFSADERRRIRKFVLSPVALAIALCIILPSVVVTGYASTLFPLFSADLGFAKADINNMYLFGQLIVYVSIGWIERLSKRIGNWRAGDYSIAGLGVVFLCFSLNTTIVWGVVVIALVGLLVKIANAWKPLWITSAGKANVPLGWATGAMFVVRSVARIAKPFILTGLILVGGRLAIIVIGAFCLVCAATLYFVTRKQW